MITSGSVSTIKVVFLLQILAGIHVEAKTYTRSVTVEIQAGRMDCFYLPNIKTGQTVDFEFQVTAVSSTTAMYDINVRIFTPDPERETVYEALLEKEGNHEFEATVDGDYPICMDNQMSTWTEKTVWFEVTVFDSEYDYNDDYIDDERLEEMKGLNEETASAFDLKVEEIQGSLFKVRHNVGKVKHYQLMFGATMSLDTNQVLMNLERINFWSAMHLAVVFIVGFSQIYVIRRFFEEKGKIHNLQSKI